MVDCLRVDGLMADVFSEKIATTNPERSCAISFISHEVGI